MKFNDSDPLILTACLHQNHQHPDDQKKHPSAVAAEAVFQALWKINDSDPFDFWWLYGVG